MVAACAAGAPLSELEALMTAVTDAGGNVNDPGTVGTIQPCVPRRGAVVAGSSQRG